MKSFLKISFLLFITSFFVQDIQPNTFVHNSTNPGTNCSCNGNIKLGGRFNPTSTTGNRFSFESLLVINQTTGGPFLTFRHDYAVSDPAGPLVHTFSNLCGGSYKWILSIKKGTTQTRTTVASTQSGTFLLTGGGPTPTNLAISGLQPCYNNGGTVSLTGSATGVGPVTFEWFGPAGQMFTGATLNLTTDNNTNGTWILQASTNNNGVKCSAQLPFTINVPFITTTNPSFTICQGQSITLFANPSGQTDYFWGAPLNVHQQSVTVSPTITTAYTVTVTFTNGCQATATQTVTVLNGPAATLSTSTPTVCPGGSIVLNAGPAGQANYSFATPNRGTINNGTNPTLTLTNAVAADSGTYTVTVTDANGCTGTASTSVSVDSLVFAPGSPSATPTCDDLNNGSISVSVNGGSAPYTYSNGITSMTTAATNFTFTGLAAGTYTVTVTDAAGCTITAPVVVGTDNLAFAASSPTATPTCGNQNTGTITASITGGSAPYTYSNGITSMTTAATSFTFTGLAGGTYTVTVTDSNNCSVSAPVVVGTDNFAFAQGSPSTTPTCEGQSTGTITVAVTGGISPFTYSDGITSVTTGASSFTFTNLAAGTYTITVKDAINCTITASAVVGSQSCCPMTFANGTPSTTPSCAGQSNGTITVNTTGGTGPNWTFSNGVTTTTVASPDFTFTNVAAGTYTITVTDSANCTITGTAVVATDNLAFANGSPTTTPACSDQSNGSITASVTGGIPPFVYSDGITTTAPTAATSFTFTNLAAGTYTVTVTDANNCVVTAPAVVPTDNLAFATGSPSTTPSCPGQSNGSITASVTGGMAPYTYSNGITSMTTAATTFTFTNLASGTYTVTVTDANNCTVTASAVVGSDNLAFADGSPSTTPSCESQSTGTITAAVTGGTAPYTYSNGMTSATTAATSFTFTNLAAGTYTVTVTDANNCTVTASAVVGSQVCCPMTFANGTPTTTPSCANQSTGTIVVNTTGGTGPNWTFSNGVTTITVASPNFTFTNVAAGTYTITVTDSADCTITGTAVVAQDNLAFANGSPSTTPACSGQSNGSITASITGGTAPFTYSNGISSVTTSATSFTFTGLAAGPYTVTVTDANNCSIAAPAVVPTDNLAFAEGSPSTTPSCEGQSTGTISVSVTGGTAPFTYSNGISSVTTAASSFTFTGLAAGTYVVTVTDDNDCSIVSTVVVGSITCNTTTLSIQEFCPCKIKKCNVGAKSILIENTGSAPATNVKLVDILPTCLNFVSATGSGWSFNVSGQQVTGTLPTLAPGATTLVTINVLAACGSGKKLQNAVTVTASNVAVPQTASCCIRVD